MASPPHFVQDHILAISAWAILYMAECAGLSFWNKAKKPSDLAVNVLASLPRLLVPSEGLAMLLPEHFFIQSKAQDLAAAAAPAAVPTGTMQKEPPAKKQSSQASLQGSLPRQSKQRRGLKPGQWDPNDDFNNREEIARRTYLKDMYYCVGALPKKGLETDKLFEAQVMSKKFTYWQGVSADVIADERAKMFRWDLSWVVSHQFLVHKESSTGEGQLQSLIKSLVAAPGRTCRM